MAIATQSTERLTEECVSYNPPEEGMLAVQLIRAVWAPSMGELGIRGSRNGPRLTQRDEELGVVRILRAVIRHPNQTTVHETQPRVNLILERF